MRGASDEANVRSMVTFSELNAEHGLLRPNCPLISTLASIIISMGFSFLFVWRLVYLKGKAMQVNSIYEMVVSHLVVVDKTMMNVAVDFYTLPRI